VFRGTIDLGARGCVGFAAGLAGLAGGCLAICMGVADGKFGPVTLALLPLVLAAGAALFALKQNQIRGEKRFLAEFVARTIGADAGRRPE
jgi:hypothetical protein